MAGPRMIRLLVGKELGKQIANTLCWFAPKYRAGCAERLPIRSCDGAKEPGCGGVVDEVYVEVTCMAGRNGRVGALPYEDSFHDTHFGKRRNIA